MPLESLEKDYHRTKQELKQLEEEVRLGLLSQDEISYLVKSLEAKIDTI